MLFADKGLLLLQEQGLRMGRPGWGEETESKQRCGWRCCYWFLQSAKARREPPSPPWTILLPLPA